VVHDACREFYRSVASDLVGQVKVHGKPSTSNAVELEFTVKTVAFSDGSNSTPELAWKTDLDGSDHEKSPVVSNTALIHEY